MAAASYNSIPKYDIYIRDKAIDKTSSNGPQHHSKSAEDLRSFLEGLIPRPVSSVRLVKLGYIVVYATEDSVNYYFDPRTCRDLQNAGLEFKLSFKSQEQREIFILDPPLYIYNKMEQDIIPDLEQQNNITILSLHKFESKKTLRKYFKIILSCENDKNRIVNNKNIKIFLDELRATPRIAKQHPSGRQQQPGPSTNSRNYTNNYNNTNNNNNYNNNNNNNSTYLPSTSVWGKRFQHGPIAGNNYNSNRNHGLMPSPPGLATVETQAAELDMKIFLMSVSNIAEKLSSGMPNPEMFVMNFNSVLTHNGYNAVNIPNDILESSKLIYKTKWANNQAHNFLENEFFHNPQIFQRPPPSSQATYTTTNDTISANTNENNTDPDTESDANSETRSTHHGPTVETNSDITEETATAPTTNDDSDNNKDPIHDSTANDNSITNSDTDNDASDIPENDTLRNATDLTESLNSTTPFPGIPTSPSSAIPHSASSLSQSEPNLSCSNTPPPTTPTDQNDLIFNKNKNNSKSILRSSIRTTLRSLKKKAN